MWDVVSSHVTIYLASVLQLFSHYIISIHFSRRIRIHSSQPISSLYCVLSSLIAVSHPFLTTTFFILYFFSSHTINYLASILTTKFFMILSFFSSLTINYLASSHIQFLLPIFFLSFSRLIQLTTQHPYLKRIFSHYLLFHIIKYLASIIQTSEIYSFLTSISSSMLCGVMAPPPLTSPFTETILVNWAET